MYQKAYFSLEDAQAGICYSKPKLTYLVTGDISFKKSGAEKRLERLLSMSHRQFVHKSEYPTKEELRDEIKFFEQSQPDVVLAIGGGGAIDRAKLIIGLSKLSSQPYFVAVPTTAGSGSESTPFAVYYENGIKNSLENPYLLPNTIVLDPTLTYSLSKKQTAISGMDALAQGIESYWSVNSTEDSRDYSQEAISIVLNHLGQAVNNPNPHNRERMLKAANLAGRAIAIAKATACHAISYPITSRFGIPHGHAVALTLPEVFEHNCNVTEQNCNDKRGVEYVKKTMEELKDFYAVASSKKAKEMLYSLIASIGLETRLSKLGIDDEGIETIVKEGFNPQRMKNNPARIEESDLRRILERIR